MSLASHPACAGARGRRDTPPAPAARRAEGDGSARRLLDDVAGDPSAATAERLGLVRVVVAAGVDYERVALERGEIRDVRGGELLAGGAVGRDLESREVAEVAVTLGTGVLPGASGV